ALREAGAMMEALDFLRKAQRLHPGDFWLNHDLAWYLCYLQPPRKDEGLGFVRIALALRSDSPKVLLALGWQLHFNGATDDGIAALRRAIKLDPNFVRLHFILAQL